MTWTSWRTGRACTPSPASACWGWRKSFPREKPDLVLVHGDTSTTFSGALAAFYQKIAVGHVEAGLRTGDRYSPFPEEMNRTLVGDLASLHFCPHPGQPGEPPGGGDPGGHLRHRQHGDRRPEDHRPAGLPVPHGPAEHPGLPGEAGHPGSPATGGRNYGQPMENIMKALRRLAEELSGGGTGLPPSTYPRWSRRWPGGTSPAIPGST